MSEDATRSHADFPADDVLCTQCDDPVNLDDADLVTFEDGDSGYVCSKCAHATPDRVARYEAALETAIDGAWARYKDYGSSYREGYADALEWALLLFHRSEHV